MLDPLGDHWASCMRSARVRRRALPLERVCARVFREGGARVQEKVFQRYMCLLGVPATNGRRLEVVATGLPLARGVLLGVDVTMVSVLHADGEAGTRVAATAGVAIARAEAAKSGTYPELDGSGVVRLTTLACETGGRWSEAAADTIAQLAVLRARAAPKHLQLSTRLASESR